MAFQVGEKVVYPNHGVGTIENISMRCFGAQSEHYYLLRMNGHGMTVMVPFSHVGHVGLRKVTKNVEIGRVLLFLSSGKSSCNADWKNRFKENSDKMQGGSLLAIAEVFKMLLTIQKEKPLSFREKKMLDRARHMLITEISISRGVTTIDAIDLLQRSLLKSCLSMPEAL